MKVLYDHQAFRYSRYGGVPRYFCELYQQYAANSDVDAVIPTLWNINEDYNNLNLTKPNITYHARNKAVNLSLTYTSMNISRFLDFGDYKSISLLKKQDFDLFHPTWYNQYYPKYVGNKPVVLTIHDLTYDIYPDYFRKHDFGPAFLRKNADVPGNLRKSIESTTRYIAVSKNTKKDFIRLYDVDKDLVDVVYHGSPFEKYFISRKKDDNLSDSSSFLLYVGGRTGYKNFTTFIDAAAPVLLSENLHCLCVGGGCFSNEEIEHLHELGIQDRVSQKYVNDHELIQLYNSASLFIYPSLNEGFGLPLLEAFSCGCPVICSESSCFPEIADDAAVYFNPLSVTSITDALYSVLSDEKKRLCLMKHGYAQLSKFSWKKCANETRCVYEKAIE